MWQAVEALNLSGSTYQQYRDRGVTAYVAHSLADKAGVHPYEVWPDLLDAEIASLERECAATDCSERFIPPLGRGRHQKFHDDGCRRREKMRRYRARDHGREVNRLAARRYRESVAEMVARRAGRQAA